MAQGSGSTVLKVVVGVVLGFLLLGMCVAGGCFLLVGRTAMKVSEAQEERDAYGDKLTISVQDAKISHGFMKFNGSVRNDGGEVVRYWKVKVRLLDSSGSTIDTAFTNSAQRLGPGESKSFQIMLRETPGVKDYRYEVEEVRLAQ